MRLARGWAPPRPEVDRTTRALADSKKDRLGDRQSVTPTAAVLKSWAEPTVARGDLAEEVVRLKEQPGKFILAHGGARFAQSLVASGLIDEYRLVIHPVALGRAGRRRGDRRDEVAAQREGCAALLSGADGLGGCPAALPNIFTLIPS